MPRSLRLGAVFLASALLIIGAYFLVERALNHLPNLANPGDAENHKPPGRLVVLIVFDQMRGDYLSRWAEQFGSGGFQRMKTNGVWYSDVHLPYACSSTGPGHAAISTGAPPSVNGIIENEWFDRSNGELVYCVQPTRPFELVPPPPKAGRASRGATTGFSPERLLVETVGDRLQAANAKSRVVSLSIKDRTAVLLGGKKPTAMYCFDTRDGLFHTDTYYRDSVHPWVAEFNASGKVKEWIGTEWTHFRKDVDYEKQAGRDDAPGEAYGVTDIGFGQKRVFPHPFPTKEQFELNPKLYYSCVEVSPAGNRLLFELAKKAIDAEKLGNGEAADLLCLSFSSNDLIGHYWGPNSQEMLDITLRSDAMIAELLAFLDEKLGDRYSVVITADHGVCPIPEQNREAAAARKSPAEIYPPLAAALEATYGAAPTGPTRWFEVDGRDAVEVWPWIYLNQAAIKKRGLDPAAVADFAAQWLGNRPFMQTAFTRKQIETGTLPPVGGDKEAEVVRKILNRVKLAYRPDRCGDLIGIPRPGVLVTPYPEGTSHGSPYEYDTHVPVLAFGTGVPVLGARPEPRSSLMVAPTVAALLGIAPPAAAKEKPAFEPPK